MRAGEWGVGVMRDCIDFRATNAVGSTKINTIQSAARHHAAIYGILGAFLLTACATQQDPNAKIGAAIQQTKMAMADCRAIWEVQKQTYRERASCINAAQGRIMGPVEANRDLLEQEMAYRLVIADQ